jgi:hypothetical protein
MPEFTKGEWKVDLESGEITVNDSMVIGTVYGSDDYPCCDEDISEECKANAHLIAAAPDMYEAIIDNRANMTGEYDRKSCGHKFFCVCPEEKINKAIAKAEGREL